MISLTNRKNRNKQQQHTNKCNDNKFKSNKRRLLFPSAMLGIFLMALIVSGTVTQNILWSKSQTSGIMLTSVYGKEEDNYDDESSNGSTSGVSVDDANSASRDSNNDDDYDQDIDDDDKHLIVADEGDESQAENVGYGELDEESSSTSDDQAAMNSNMDVSSSIDPGRNPADIDTNGNVERQIQTDPSKQITPGSFADRISDSPFSRLTTILPASVLDGLIRDPDSVVSQFSNPEGRANLASFVGQIPGHERIPGQTDPVDGAVPTNPIEPGRPDIRQSLGQTQGIDSADDFVSSSSEEARQARALLAHFRSMYSSHSGPDPESEADARGTTSQQIRSEILSQDRLAEESNPGTVGRIVMTVLELLHIGHLLHLSTDSRAQQEDQQHRQERQERQAQQERQERQAQQERQERERISNTLGRQAPDAGVPTGPRDASVPGLPGGVQQPSEDRRPGRTGGSSSLPSGDGQNPGDPAAGQGGAYLPAGDGQNPGDPAAGQGGAYLPAGDGQNPGDPAAIGGNIDIGA